MVGESPAHELNVAMEMRKEMAKATREQMRRSQTESGVPSS